MLHTPLLLTKTEVIRYSWDNQVIGGVKFHDSIVELTYLGETYFLPPTTIPKRAISPAIRPAEGGSTSSSFLGRPTGFLAPS